MVKPIEDMLIRFRVLLANTLRYLIAQTLHRSRISLQQLLLANQKAARRTAQL
jgi:hypothetical protein